MTTDGGRTTTDGATTTGEEEQHASPGEKGAMGPKVRRDARWRLEDERQFLVRSLDDADLEHRAGDLSETDHAALQRRDQERLVEVEGALRALEAEGAARTPPDLTGAGSGGERVAHSTKRSRLPRAGARGAAQRRGGPPRMLRPRWLALVGGIAIALGAVLLVVQLMSPRLPGEAPSGSVDLSQPQQVQRELAQAADLVNRGQLVEALQLYERVLKAEPRQPQALAERGWLEYEAGVETREPALVARGRASVEEAVRVEPGGYPGHLYLGTIELQQDHDPAAAVGEFRLFLSERPPQQLIDQAAPFLRQAFADDHQALPTQVPASGGSAPPGSGSPGSGTAGTAPTG